MQSVDPGLLASRFRLNPALDLKRFEELPPAQRQALTDLEQHGELEAVLVPRDASSNLTVKAVDHRMATLFAGLRQPAVLDPDDDPGELARSISALLLDGVLQIEADDGFVSGPSAHTLIFGRISDGRTEDRPTDLSIEALRYGQTLPLGDARSLSHRLYAYNRVPLHPRWQERFGDPERARTALGLGPRDRLTALLATDYELTEPGGWRSWSRVAYDPEGLHHKLYVSPHPESLPAAFRITVETLVELGVRAFKVGDGLFDLLRADKLVAYFESRDEVLEAAGALTSRLSGLRPQGVPFTAALTPDSMLSWGVDPPIDGALVAWRGVESWRLWITNQLAVSLLLARGQETGGVPPWRFALDHLRLQGIDTETWTIHETASGGVRW